MSTVNNTVLGYRECPDCLERGTVHQANRKGRDLYQRCGCGCEQRNSALMQSRLWYETDWLTDLKPEIPAKVLQRHDYEKALARIAARSSQLPIGQTDREGQENPASEGEEGAGQSGEGDRAGEPIGQPAKQGTGLFWMIAIGVGLVAAVLRA